MKNIIIKPLVTEKVASQNEKGTYGFVVNRTANKVEIKKAVENLYNVKVADVNTMIVRGKAKSKWTKAGLLQGKNKSYKKAMIKVAEGEIIDIYSGI